MAKKTQTPPRNFEDALRELEQILAEIEGGEMGLEESLLKYERGNFLILHCRGVLNSAEKQIDLLGKSEDGGLSRSPLPSPPIEAVSTEEASPDDARPATGRLGPAGGQDRSGSGPPGNLSDEDDV